MKNLNRFWPKDFIKLNNLINKEVGYSKADNIYFDPAMGRVMAADEIKYLVRKQGALWRRGN